MLVLKQPFAEADLGLLQHPRWSALWKPLTITKRSILNVAAVLNPSLIRFFTARYKILKTIPKLPSVYSQQNKILKIAPNAICLFTTIHEILKTVSKRPFVFL